MKKITLFSILCMLTVLGTTNINAQNLLLNPGFELGVDGDGYINNWQISPDDVTKATFTVETADKHSGTASAKITYVSGGYNDLYQAVPVTAGKTYTFSFWYNVIAQKVAGSGRVVLVPTFYDNNSSPIPIDPSTYEGTYTLQTWQQYSVDIVAPANAASVDFRIRLLSRPNALIDDASITLASTGTIAVTGVTLNKTTLALTAGGSEPLTTIVAPADATDKSVSWASDNSAIATVDANGNVTAVAAGNATITVTSTDGSKTATCAVTVTAATVAVTGVTLNKTTLPLTVGGSETLTATLAPANPTNPSVSWASDNSAVATVDNAGKVTAIAAGIATITVTTTDGSKTATCAVTVTAATVAVTGVTLNKTTLPLTTGTSETLTATLAPANPTNPSVSWASDNSAVATVDANGNVTAVAAGTATITVTTVDGSKTASCVVTVSGVAKTAQTISGLSNITKTVGDAAFDLSATASTAVTYVSSNTAVATISGSTVTIVGAGTTTITASAAGNDTYNAAPDVTATLTVNKIAQTISGLTDLTKTIGDADFNLAATASSGLSVTYASSNTAVATISGSAVHIVGIGTTTITASQTGNDSYSAATPVTATLTVEGIKVSAIRLGLSLLQGSSAKLTATVSPTNASNTGVNWSSDNTSVATVDNNGNLSAISVGTALITVASTDGAKSVEFAITVNINTANNAPTAENDFSFSVQPNPVADEARFSFGLAGDGASIVISDLTGKTLAVKTVSANSTAATVSVSGLSNGIYIARYADATGKQATVKMIK